MTHEDAFIQSILDAPNDEAPRLVFADWLEDEGQPIRAELVRVQTSLMSLPRGDLRRARLVLRERTLRRRCKGEWAEHLGLLMSWDSLLALFRRRLAETIAWCATHRANGEFLRTATLVPPSLLSGSTGEGGGWHCPTSREREAIVNALANRRAQLLVAERGHPPSLDNGLAGGRLLLFAPDGTLSDGAAEVESGGFFDADNVPPWDTWVICIGPAHWRVVPRLVAWAPPAWAHAADAGMAVNPERCVMWAEEIDTVFTRKLRAAELLA
jgi:uncharacterized protein (TIGR02996 family)